MTTATSSYACAALPRTAYFDTDFYEREQTSLFRNTWVCVGFAGDLPTPGCVKPFRLAGRSLFMMKDSDGQIRVFHNFCRHRGFPLVDKSDCLKRNLVCPYHAWSYALDGTFVSAPHYDGVGKHADRSKQPVDGLLEVCFEQWNGLLFVNLNGNASPLMTHLEPLIERWGGYDFSLLRLGERCRFDIACNWKLAVENFIDIYHLPPVHHGLNSYCAMEDCYFVEGGDLFLGQGTYPYLPDDDAVDQLPVFPGLSEKAKKSTEAIWLSPNLLVTVFPDNLRVIRVEPVSPTHCIEDIGVFFVDDQALAPGLEHYRQLTMARFREFNDEDIEIVESLQRGLTGSDYDGGHFSPAFDRNVGHFQSIISRQVNLESPA